MRRSIRIRGDQLRDCCDNLGREEEAQIEYNRRDESECEEYLEGKISKDFCNKRLKVFM